MLAKAVAMFEDFLQYTNHLGLCTEEISDAGEAYVPPLLSPFSFTLPRYFCFSMVLTTTTVQAG